MKRINNWPRHLNAYIVASRDRRFKWGNWDCCAFAAGAVEAITGEDPMQEFRGKYSSQEEAAEILRGVGAGSLYKTLRSKFGNPVPGAKGKRGDVAWHEGACGVVVGRFALFLHEEGFGTVPISSLYRAFRVPE